MADPETPADPVPEPPYTCPHLLTPPDRCYIKFGAVYAAAFREDGVRVCPSCLKPTAEIDATPAPA